MNKPELVQLVKKAKGHDPDAFMALIQHYKVDLYRVAVAILMNDADAADAIQDTFLICWEHTSELKKPRYFKTWMTRILINCCYAIRRKRADQIPVDECPELMAADDNMNIEFNEMLSSLDEKYRVPMILYYSEGYKAKEIADLLEIPVSTIQTRLARGRTILARELDEGRNIR